MTTPLDIEPRRLYDDAALLLLANLRPATLARARRAGTLRYTKQGGRVLYLGEWLLDWLKNESRSEVTNDGSR